MIFYSENNILINEDTLELIYFFIPKYKVFNNFGISLFPKYTITVNNFNFDNEEIEITICEKENFIDLFQKEQINLKIICGKNGCGKTTLLKLLSGEFQPEFKYRKKITNQKNLSGKSPNMQEILAEMSKPDTRYDCIYIFKDNADHFISNKITKINFNNSTQYLNSSHNHISFTANTVCVTHKNMGIQDFSIDNNIVRYFRDYPFIFKGILPEENPLFTHFNISLKDFNSEVDDLLNSNLKDFLVKYEKYDLINTIKTDWILYYFLHCLRDISYENFLNKIRHCLLDDDSVDFLEILSRYLENNEEVSYNDIKEELDEIKNKNYLLKDLDKIQTKVNAISKKIQNLICKSIGEEFNLTFGFQQFIAYKGFFYEHGNIRYFNDLSTGEQLQFIYRYQIFHSMYQKERIYWYIDEPDEGLHPEWCRTFINDYVNTYENIKRIVEKNKEFLSTTFNKDKRITIIISTHSPFMLSDVTNDYISYLEKNEENITNESFNHKNSFAGNIGEMFSENFFMTKTIGDFATKKINNMIEVLNSDERISSTQYNYFNTLIKSIGDDLLRSLLAEKLEDKIEKDRIK